MKNRPKQAGKKKTRNIEEKFEKQNTHNLIYGGQR